MRMTHIYKSNKYRPMICWISQKPRNDLKTVKFLFFVKYIIIAEINGKHNFVTLRSTAASILHDYYERCCLVGCLGLDGWLFWV